MQTKIIGWLRKMNASRSAGAARATTCPATELLMQAARLHVAR